METERMPAARDRLIVSLDVSSIKDAQAMVDQVGDAATFYKIGYQLGYAGGIPFGKDLIAGGKQLFFDFKLHDISNTVAKGIESLATMGATFATVHAYPQTMKAAADAARGSDLKVLAVTVLTSFDDADLALAGYRDSVRVTIERRAQQALEAGVHGLVCSGEEAAAVRKIVGPDLALVIPGIRPTGAALGDQKRAMTPANAIAAGADYLVVGRPIIAADDPRAAAAAIINEIEMAGS